MDEVKRAPLWRTAKLYLGSLDFCLQAADKLANGASTEADKRHFKQCKEDIRSMINDSEVNLKSQGIINE